MGVCYSFENELNITKKTNVKRTFIKLLQKQDEAMWVSSVCIVDSSGWVTFYILLAQICLTTRGKRWQKVRQVALNNVHFILIAGCAPFVWSKSSKPDAIPISSCATPLLCIATLKNSQGTLNNTKPPKQKKVNSLQEVEGKKIPHFLVTNASVVTGASHTGDIGLGLMLTPCALEKLLVSTEAVFLPSF